MRKQLFVVVLVILFSAGKTFSQDSASSFSVSGYVDAYIAYYTDSVGTGDYQKFPTISPRSKQFGLNIAQISANYSSNRLRGIVTLQYGDIPRSAWSPTFNFIQEANIGVRIYKKLWLDAGFFKTHIGTESLLPKDNITSSLAIGTYFEPFYQAGLKLSYNPTEKLALSLYLLNGYNLFEDNNNKKSVGLLATYSINDHFGIAYDNYLGDDSPEGDTMKHLRFYNNAVLNFETDRIKIVTGADFGIQQNSSLEGQDKSASVYSGLFSIRYAAAKMFGIYGRAEIFHDADGFLSGIITDKENQLTGLKVWGATLGAEFKPTNNSYIRLEGRDLIADSEQEIFYWNGKQTNTRFEAMLNFGIWFP